MSIDTNTYRTKYLRPGSSSMFSIYIHRYCSYYQPGFCFGKYRTNTMWNIVDLTVVGSYLRNKKNSLTVVVDGLNCCFLNVKT